MSLGGAATFWLTGELMEIMHWRSVFQVYSLVGILWAVAFWFVFRTRPEQHPLVDSVYGGFPGLSDRAPDEQGSVEPGGHRPWPGIVGPHLARIDGGESPPAPGPVAVYRPCLHLLDVRPGPLPRCRLQPVRDLLSRVPGAGARDECRGRGPEWPPGRSSA
ncbi:MAG: hypothetical protein Ct9H300mP1_17610 [Planctomycetaceae bacterium]|nr:MAG: hypothetical protein Ct9H300mP1_17610 [Planctomycetaceae bacterium]